MALLVLSALAVSTSLAWDPFSSDYSILVIVPTTNGAMAKQSWEKTEELLVGANLAKRSADRLCLPFRLSMTEIRTDCSSPAPLLLLQLVRELIAVDRGTTIAVTGFICRKISRHLIGLTSQDHLGLVQIAINTFLPVNETQQQHYHRLFPSSLVYAEALAQFMQHVGWTRVAIAYTYGYYFEISQQLTRLLEKKGFGQTIATLEINDDLHRAIKSIHASGFTIVYVLLPPEITTRLICNAYNFGLRWPDYGWVVPDVSLEDVLCLNNAKNCNENAARGIISFQMKNPANVTKVATRTCGEDFRKLLPNSLTNIYAKALYDSILTTALSLNQTFAQVQTYLATLNNTTLYSKLIAQKRVSSIVGEALSNISFQGTLGDVYFGREHITETNIVVYQTTAGIKQTLAVYQPRLNVTHFETTNSLQLPCDKLNRVYTLQPVAAEVVLTIGLAICTLITLFNTILCVYYRKTPELKASSVGLSMLIHLSCYVIIIGCETEIHKNGQHVVEHSDVCITLVWTVHPWGDIILSTLLVKICRIYHIFTHFGKIKKICSDQCLLIPVALIVSGKVVILLLWSVLDRFSIKDIEIYHPETKPPYYEVVQQCHSHHFSIWISTALGYTAILGGVLAFISFKARKIRRKDFKDTKKINLTITTSFVAIGILVPMWWIFRTTGYSNVSKVLIAMLYLIIPMCCQVCLFCPKTLPPLRRSIFKFLAKQPHRKRSRTLEKLLFLQQPNPTQLSVTLPSRATVTSLDI